MDTLLILKRPIKAVKSTKRIKLVRSKKLWAPPLKAGKRGDEALVRAKQSCETVSEKLSSVAEAQHVSFVSLYHNLCRGYYESSNSEVSSPWTSRGAGDHAPRARAHLVLEFDY